MGTLRGMKLQRWSPERETMDSPARKRWVHALMGPESRRDGTLSVSCVMGLFATVIPISASEQALAVEALPLNLTSYPAITPQSSRSH